MSHEVSLELSLESRNSSYSESSSVMIMSSNSTLSAGDALPTSLLALLDFVGLLDGLLLDFLFVPEQPCFEVEGWVEGFEA